MASSAERENGVLVVYYSTVFPRYLEYRRDLERQDPSLAESFTERYKIWLAVHSLILDEERQRQQSQREITEEITDEEEIEQQERCRVAIISAMFAAREVRLPSIIAEE